MLAEWGPPVVSWAMVAVVIGVAVALRRNRPRIALALIAVFVVVLTAGFVMNLTDEDESSQIHVGPGGRGDRAWCAALGMAYRRSLQIPAAWQVLGWKASPSHHRSGSASV